MTPKERVLRTLAHQEPDIVPWGEHLVDYNVYEGLLGRKSWVHAKFPETKAWWDGRREEIVASYKRDTVDLALALGFDLVAANMMPAVGAEPKTMNPVDETTFEENGYLYRISATTEDLCLLKTPTRPFEEPTLASLQEQIDQVDAEGVPAPDESSWEVVRHVKQTLGDDHFIVTFGGDIGFPGFGWSDAEFYLNVALHPELHAKLTELAAKKAIAGLKYYAGEVDGVIGAADYGSSSALLASPRIMQEHMVYWMKAITDEAHRLGLKFLKHSCGCLWEALPFFVEAGYDAYEGVQASAGMDMKDLKRLYGDKLTLWGGVTNENLILGSPEQVRQDALYALRYGAPGGGFIYGASHSLMIGTKLENLLVMKEMRDRYGVYPIDIPAGEGLAPGFPVPITLPEKYRC
ncbi:MAG TPA: uroporphyrinogen decarboxylase family protein [Armatimonadota bacterium]|jgi:hypothetical protein